MATIHTAIELQDNFTSVLNDIVNSVDLAVGAMEQMQQAMNRPVDAATMEGVRNQANQATAAVQELEAAMQNLEFSTAESPAAATNSAPVPFPVEPVQYIQDNIDEQGQFNQAIKQVTESASGLINSITGIAAAYKNIRTFGEAFLLPDTITEITARLGFRIDDGGSAEELQNKIVTSAQASSGFYLAAAGIIGAVGTFVYDNWSILEPIILGVVTALGLYNNAMLLYNAITEISAGITAAKVFAEQVHAASLAMAEGATFAMTAAQYGFNTALLACPITWIIVLIIALIALFYAAVAAVNKFAGTSVSATGIICGVFLVAAAYIGNLFISLINFAIDLFVLLWNFIAAFANFFANVFQDPVGAIARLFFALADTVLGVLQVLATAIDTIFGSDLAGSVQGWRDSLGGWVDGTFGKGEEVMAELNAEDRKLGKFQYDAAWKVGYSFGEGIANFDPFGSFDTDVLGEYADSLPGNVRGIADSTGRMADSMEISKEDLEYLRDVAEREVVNRFTTAQLSVSMNTEASINSDLDIDGIISQLEDKTYETLIVAAEGV